jgi:hypothetical protein
MKLPEVGTTSRLRYALRAWLLAVVPSLLVFLALVAVGANTLRPPPGALDPLVLGYSVLGAPLLETALMLALAELIALAIPGRPRARIVLLTVTCAFAHRLGGGWQQVAAAVWPFLIYSVTLIAWLERSAREAFVVTAAVHALYNASFVAVGVIGMLGTERGQ